MMLTLTLAAGLLALASGGSIVELWDLAGGKGARQFNQHHATAHCVAFSPDGRTLAAAGSYPDPKGFGGGPPYYPVIYFWDAATGEERAQFKWDPYANLEAFKPAARPNWIGGAWGAVTAIAFSPDGKTLFSGGPDTARLWEVATHRQRRLLEGHEGNFYTSLLARMVARWLAAAAIMPSAFGTYSRWFLRDRQAASRRPRT
jgi:WD40 repeat protein